MTAGKKCSSRRYPLDQLNEETQTVFDAQLERIRNENAKKISAACNDAVAQLASLRIMAVRLVIFFVFFVF